MLIYSNATLHPHQRDALSKGLAPHTVVFHNTGVGTILNEGLREPAALEADVQLGQPNVADLVASKNLKLVLLSSAGYARYDVPEVRQALVANGAILCNASTVYAEACAQHLLGFLLAQTRDLPTAILNQSRPDHAWTPGPIRKASRLVTGQSILLVGYGAIARRIATLLAPFQMEVVGFRRTPRPDHEPAPVYELQRLDEFLGTADHVVNILPEAAGTLKFFGADRFARMKDGATFYNIGRGATVDQAALVDALKSNHLRSAWLDVTSPEPLPPDHALWTAPNCHITPHTAGGFDHELDAHVSQFIDQTLRFSANEPLIDRVY